MHFVVCVTFFKTEIYKPGTEFIVLTSSITSVGWLVRLQQWIPGDYPRLIFHKYKYLKSLHPKINPVSHSISTNQYITQERNASL